MEFIERPPPESRVLNINVNINYKQFVALSNFNIKLMNLSFANLWRDFYTLLLKKNASL